ncbi:sterol desaturase family protein [Ketobacter sp. MCCC 1A13808]|uniref:sterol desaturase family protein n=1 Tax=Ketobacter sp. MCCC 1A13808 TaxID=2602738 RepID=UPI000F20C3A4|nr:sterol desaturase family protein [Ketobacter sp. MCCC 1A13808]MVF12702.1 sterol desaturase family protein [Ketobacter sp. MCCC 1A13808]RLP55504.1 MAG: sterol desaturase family protein [Ketobacter sp.]
MSDVLHAVFFVLIFGAVFVGFILVEWGYTRHKGLNSVYHFKETLANIGTGFSYKMVDGIAIALFIQAFYSWVWQFGWQWRPEASFISILMLILLVDFCFYVNHILMHKTRWFWAGHVTHHSSQHMNFSTALRQNFIHDLNGGWLLWWIPAALVGFDKNWVLLAIEGNLVYQFFLHTEQVKRLGWLEKIFNTPSHHRVHHGRNSGQIDTNFGGIFIFWDRLFGTFRDEQEAGEIVYGVTRMPEKPYNPVYLQLFELRSLWQDIRHYRDWKILVKPPEYVQQHYSDNTHADAAKQ